MNKLTCVLFIGAGLAAGLTTYEAHCAEPKQNPLVSAANSSISWFEKILLNWDTFIHGREKQKLKSELEKLESQLTELKSSKQELRDELIDVVDNGVDNERRRRIEDTLLTISEKVKQYTVAIAKLSGYVPEIHYQGATNSLALPQEELDRKRKIVSGLWKKDSKKLLSTYKSLSAEEKQKLRKSIQEDAEEAIRRLAIAIEKVREIRQKL